MRRIVGATLAALLCLAGSARAGEAIFDGTRLLLYCEEADKDPARANPFRLGHCLGFVEGTLRGWEAGALVRNMPVNYCIPPGIKFDDMLRSVLKHMRANQAEMHGKADLLVISAVQRTYPCTGAPQKR